MDRYQQRAFNEGYESYCKGHDLKDNPYGVDQDEYNQWYVGWCEAEKDNEAE